MKPRAFIPAALFSAILLTSTTAIAQSRQTTETEAQPATNGNVDVIYTGRLFGYFRVPSLQGFNEVGGCPADDKLNSKAAEQFLAVRDKQVANKTVLVGTGDNFAPQLEARVFSDVEPKGQYAVGNKELYLGSNVRWVPYDEKSSFSDTLRDQIAQGIGTIPNDNVACFLRRAKYTAIVPGKHDFYFGAERVRQFARFLAKEGSGNYEPVQMLGANLVIKTDPIESTPVSAKVKADKTFEPWPSAYPVLNLHDGKRVYPWFSIVKIQLADIPSEASYLDEVNKLPGANRIIKNTDLTAFIQTQTTKLAQDLSNAKLKVPNVQAEIDQLVADQKRLSNLATNYQATKDLDRIRICVTNGSPNDLPAISTPNCDPIERNELRLVGNKIVLFAYLKKDKFPGKVHNSTLEYGKNHFLCTTAINKKTNLPNDACMRFSTHTPFFYFPHKAPNEAGNSHGYTDPDPYALKNNVAILGVVDPMLGEQVGILNFGWTHEDNPELTSRVSAEDPADALQQQLDYFAVKEPGFSGMKVLLAQMTPQRARALAARFPEFQLVVAAADREQATSNITMSTTWKPQTQASGAFLAVPTPYFNPAKRNGSVHLGIINATKQTDNWELSAKANEGQPIPEPEDPAKNFWANIKSLPGCLQSDFQRKRNQSNESYDNQTYLQWLVLCTMQQHLGADVALIQTQDLFDKIPKLTPHMTELLNRANVSAHDAERDENVQQMLDRLIWKGDLITLIYVPGSALKKALDQSAKYASEETATFALSVDRGRKLETLGIRTDNDEYFINELPLDSNRLYAVATTDYIGAGDTGYPDLKNSARNPRGHPAKYSRELMSISSLVCRKYFSNNPSLISKYCLGPVDGTLYLDETTAKQTPPYPPEGRFSRFWGSTGLALPKSRTDSTDPADGLEHRVQRRSFRGFSLKNLSIGFKDLDNNRTDQSLKDKFAGISTSGVGSKENRTISLGLDTRFSYFADKHEYFIGLGLDYDRQSTGDPTKATGISLNKNRVFVDGGLVWWRHAGRELPNFGPVFSVHGETQLERPFSAFNLNTDEGEQVRIPQKRGALLLGRLGFRWQNRTNTAEAGVQFGREFRALRGFRFDNPGDDDQECLVNSAQTLESCIDFKSGPLERSITANSTPSALLQARPRAGIYWNHKFSFPIGSKIKYEATQDADFFFVRFHQDTSIDTRLRYNSKNSLRFMIWSNFSIGPALELFIYQNKVNGNFLFQRTLGIETTLNFDVFNRREKKAQIISRD